MGLTETGCQDVNWIYLSQDKNDCPNSVNIVKKILDFKKRRGIS